MRKKQLLTPQQSRFLQLYCDPKSETFGNACQSALRVGYRKNYALNITDNMPKWLFENLGRFQMFNKAEKNLNETLDLETENTGLNRKGDIYTFNDSRLLGIKVDVSKFVAERLGRKYYGKEEDKPNSEINITINNLALAIKELVNQDDNTENERISEVALPQ